MVQLFNLWNFFKHENNIYEFDVTQANSPGIKDGTVEWIEQCMSAFGVEVAVDSWEVIPFRSYYFSDYPKDENWQDRWTRGWTIKVFPNGETPGFQNELFDLPKSVDAADATCPPDFEEDPLHNRTALLISDHQDNLTMVEQLAQEIITQTILGSEQGTNCELSIRSFGEEMHQIRITCKRVIFPEIVVKLEESLEHCKQYNGAINWRERLTWQEQNSEQLHTQEMLAWRDQLLGGDSSDSSG